MGKRSIRKPTEAELEILKILWELGPSSVRHVHEILSGQKDIYYTTTLKTMQVMVGKGLLERDTSQRSHIYSPLVGQDEVERSLIGGLLRTVFNGSTAKLVISAIGHSKPTPEELEQIKLLIDKLDSDADKLD